MKKILTLLILSISLTLSAESKPFQLSLTPDLAIHPESTEIRGIALNVWGENQQRAINFGLVNGHKAGSSGFSYAWFVNYNRGYSGVNWAAVNVTEGHFKGWQAGFINYTSGHTYGLQTGAVNYSESLKGLQIGVINYAEHMEKGLQIGLANIIRRNHKWFGEFPDEVAPAMVFVNWKF